MSNRRFILLVPLFFSLIACSLLPAPTPVTLVETVEVEVTRPVTQVVVVTVTPSPTPPPTPEPQTLFADDFEAGAGEWSVGDFPEGSISVVDGKLIIEVLKANWTIVASHPELDLLDTYALDVDVSYASGPTGSDAGFAFRCGSEQWLDLAMDADGYFSIFRALTSNSGLQYDDIVPWVRLSALNRGQAVNRVRIVDDNKELTVHVNEELVAQIPFEDIPPGCPVLYAGTFEEGGGVWSFDNLSVREIER